MMNQKSSNVVRTKSQINYNYATIKITQSRIDKGLLAIPVTLSDHLPGHNETVQVYLNDSPESQSKQYSSYNSSTRECRIGGMREWFQQNNIKSGDEIVIQFIDEQHYIYRLIPERNFILQTRDLQDNFDNSKTERQASNKITTLSEWAHVDKNHVIFNEYYRLANTLPKEREYIVRSSSRARESVPSNLRILLENIYKGRCQVCDYWFIKRDQRPYFETHHLDPLKGHHPKNILVVCGNCHNQFEHADVRQEFNDELWLVKVAFNNNMHAVRQAILDQKLKVFFKELFI